MNKNKTLQATTNEDNTTSRAITLPKKTISITGLDFNGYEVIVGIKKGSGVFRYILGDKKEAIRVGEEMKEQEAKFFFNWGLGKNKPRKLYVELRAVKLSRCKVECCNNFCESGEDYCLGCLDNINDARIEYEEYCKSKNGDENE